MIKEIRKEFCDACGKKSKLTRALISRSPTMTGITVNVCPDCLEVLKKLNIRPKERKV